MKIAAYFFCCLVLMSFLACQKEVVTLSTQTEDNFYIRNGGSDMPVWVYGNSASKVLVIMLHGGPGGNGLTHHNLRANRELEEKYAMVYWDQRHQGNAHGHLSNEEVTIGHMIEDLHLLVRTLKKRYGEENSIFLMGASWGGKLGTAFLATETYQNDINGWINIAGALDTRREVAGIRDMVNRIGQNELDAGNNTAFWTEFRDYANGLDTAKLSLKQYLKINRYSHQVESNLLQVTAPDNSSIDRDIVSPHNPVNALLMNVQLNSSPFMERDFFQMSQVSALEKITLPSLVIWGQYDFVVPTIMGHLTYERMSSSDKELKIYEASSHSPQYNEPDRFVMDVSQFIETHK